MQRKAWVLGAIGMTALAALTAAALMLGVSVWWPAAQIAPTSTHAPTPVPTPLPTSTVVQNTPTVEAYRLGLPHVSVPAPTPRPTIQLAQMFLPTPAPEETQPVPTAALAFAPSPTARVQLGFAAAASGSGTCAGIVTRTGDQLTLDGEPFRFLGTNSAYIVESYFPQREFEPILKPVGETFPNAMFRIWVAPGWDLDRVERILDIGAKYGVRFTITLDDYHREKSEHWFQSTFRMEYLPHVKEVVKRFRNHPAVAIWELMNEPTCGPENFSQSCLDAQYGWVKETSEAIKALDPCRPVSIGTTGFLWVIAADRDSFRRMHALSSVDLVSIHKQVGSAEAEIIQVARELGKPWFFGEVYYRVYDDACQPIRSELLGERAGAVEDDIRKSLNEGASGYLLWQYAAGPVDMGDKIQWFCGWYEYYRDDPTHARIRDTDWDLDR